LLLLVLQRRLPQLLLSLRLPVLLLLLLLGCCVRTWIRWQREWPLRGWLVNRTLEQTAGVRTYCYSFAVAAAPPPRPSSVGAAAAAAAGGALGLGLLPVLQLGKATEHFQATMSEYVAHRC
jgi:hypothetical protein